jgi:hypothetical protein
MSDKLWSWSNSVRSHAPCAVRLRIASSAKTQHNTCSNKNVWTVAVADGLSTTPNCHACSNALNKHFPTLIAQYGHAKHAITHAPHACLLLRALHVYLATTSIRPSASPHVQTHSLPMLSLQSVSHAPLHVILAYRPGSACRARSGSCFKQITPVFMTVPKDILGIFRPCSAYPAIHPAPNARAKLYASDAPLCPNYPILPFSVYLHVRLSILQYQMSSLNPHANTAPFPARNAPTHPVNAHNA